VDANRRPAYDIRKMAKQISKRDKTSLVIDRAKVAEAREILGTTTLAETVDAALEEVIALAARRRLMERIRRDGGIGPSPEELRRLRRPRGGPLPR
jgi:Arc/MetJ family transcription regulator